MLVPDIEGVEFLPPQRFRPRSTKTPGEVRVGFYVNGESTGNTIVVPVNSPAGANVFIAKGRMMVVVVEDLECF